MSSANIGINLAHGEPPIALRQHDGYQWIEITSDSTLSIAIHGNAQELAEFAASITQVAEYAEESPS